MSVSSSWVLPLRASLAACRVDTLPVIAQPHAARGIRRGHGSICAWPRDQRRLVNAGEVSDFSERGLSDKKGRSVAAALRSQSDIAHPQEDRTAPRTVKSFLNR